MPNRAERRHPTKTERKLLLKYKGKSYSIAESDITGVETKDFRSEVNISPGAALSDPANKLDVDTLSAFVWIFERRVNPKLTWASIASEMTLGNIDIDFTDGTNADSKTSESDDEGDDDPEA